MTSQVISPFYTRRRQNLKFCMLKDTFYSREQLEKR